MSLTELVESDGYKKFMAKLYGWGASVVLVGALFKIQHYPGASLMLIVGLLTEAIIFFFSAFEPVHEELDWTLVYPELAGLDEANEEIKKPGSALEKFDALIENAGLESGLFNKLGEGMNKLSKTVNNLSEISDATVATQAYAKSISGAASSVDAVSSAYLQSADAIKKNAEVVSKSGESYKSVIEQAGENYRKVVGESASSYQGILESLNKNFSSIDVNTKSQAEQQELLTKNLSALNAVYELQLKSSNETLKSSTSVSDGITKIMQDLKDTSSDVAKYKDEVAKLSKNLSALNTVYGNMLAAMNIK